MHQGIAGHLAMSHAVFHIRWAGRFICMAVNRINRIHLFSLATLILVHCSLLQSSHAGKLITLHKTVLDESYLLLQLFLGSDVAAMFDTLTRSRRKTLKDILSTLCPPIEETFRDSTRRPTALHHRHSVSTQTPSSSTFLILSQDWLGCQ